MENLHPIGGLVNNPASAPQFYPAAPTSSKRASMPTGWNSPSALAARNAAREAAATYDTLASSVASIATPLVCFDIAGSHTAGAVLGRILYWHRAAKSAEGAKESRLRVILGESLWLAKEYGDWWEECRVSEAEAKAAIARLVKLGIIETRVKKFSGNPTVHIRLLEGAFVRKWKEALENPNQDGTYRPRSGGKKAESKAVTYREPKAQKAGIEKRKKAESLTGVSALATQEQQHALEAAVVEVAKAHNDTNREVCVQLDAQVLVADEATAALVEELTAARVSVTAARDLVSAHTAAEIRLQLDCLPERSAKNPAAILVKSIREDWEVPAKYLERQEATQREEKRKLRAEAERSKAMQQEAVKREQRAQGEDEAAQLDAAFEALPASEQARIDAAAKSRLGVLAMRMPVAALAAMRRTLMREKLQGAAVAVSRRDFSMPQPSEIQLTAARTQ